MSGADHTSVVVVDRFPGAVVERGTHAGAVVEVLRVREWSPAFRADFDAWVARVSRAGPAAPRVLSHGRGANELWACFESVPRLPLRALLRDNREGIALPMALALVSSLSSSLLHTQQAHGSLGLDCAAVAVDGSARFHWRPRTGAPAGVDGSMAMMFLENLDTMSPDLVASHADAGAADDVFTLGAVLYALLAGRSPFAREDWVSTWRALRGAAHRLAHPGVPVEIADVVAAMLAPHSADRPLLAEVAPALRAAAPWARFSDAQVADELRALAPDAVSRLTRRAPVGRQPRDERARGAT